jgi:uncharacterized protein YlaI
MNLQKCKAHNETIIKVPCCNCSTVKEISTMFADLDGEPLRSYYCDTCADEIETELYCDLEKRIKEELLNKGSI